MDRQKYIEAGLFHSIHTSERKAFRACRRRWDWSYRQSYHPKVVHRNLEFGTAYHAAKEVWYDPDKWNDNRIIQSKMAINAFITTCKEQFKRYCELNGDPSDEVLEDYKARLDLGIKMVRYYTQRISPAIDRDLTPLAVELPFEVDTELNCMCDACYELWLNSALGKEIIANCEKEKGRECDTRDHFEIHGLPITFGGRIDAIFKDKLGRILVFDWKTAERMIDGEDEAAFLQLDDQVGGYPAALFATGRQVNGFIYHEQRKAVPGPPKKLSRKYKGRMFSTDKDAPVEYETFLNAVITEDLQAYEAGLYDDYLHHLSGPGAPKFYKRHVIYKTDIQMENFWNDLIAEIKDMTESPRVYKQASRFSCNGCAYRQPCEGKDRGEDYVYTLDTLFTRTRA